MPENGSVFLCFFSAYINKKALIFLFKIHTQKGENPSKSVRSFCEKGSVDHVVDLCYNCHCTQISIYGIVRFNRNQRRKQSEWQDRSSRFQVKKQRKTAKAGKRSFVPLLRSLANMDMKALPPIRSAWRPVFQRGFSIIISGVRKSSSFQYAIAVSRILRSNSLG